MSKQALFAILQKEIRKPLLIKVAFALTGHDAIIIIYPKLLQNYL